MLYTKRGREREGGREGEKEGGRAGEGEKGGGETGSPVSMFGESEVRKTTLSFPNSSIYP